MHDDGDGGGGAPSRAVRCLTPPSDAGFVNLEVSLNGAVGEYTASGLPYRYDAHVSLAELSPDVGPVGGGTLVTISAIHSYEGLLCRFTGSGGSALGQRATRAAVATRVGASRVTSTRVACITPSMAAPGVRRYPHLRVTFANLR